MVRIRLGAPAFSITQTETASKARDRDELGATPRQLRFAPWGTEPGLATRLATIEHLCSGKTCACQTNARSPCARSIRPAAAYARSPTPRLLLGTHFLRTGGELGTRQTRSSCLRAVPLERAGCVGRLTCSTALPRQSGWSAEARALSVSHRSNSSVLPPRSLWICRSVASCFATSRPVGQRPLRHVGEALALVLDRGAGYEQHRGRFRRRLELNRKKRPRPPMGKPRARRRYRSEIPQPNRLDHEFRNGPNLSVDRARRKRKPSVAPVKGDGERAHLIFQLGKAPEMAHPVLLVEGGDGWASRLCHAMP